LELGKSQKSNRNYRNGFGGRKFRYRLGGGKRRGYKREFKDLALWFEGLASETYFEYRFLKGKEIQKVNSSGYLICE